MTCVIERQVTQASKNTARCRVYKTHGRKWWVRLSRWGKVVNLLLYCSNLLVRNDARICLTINSLWQWRYKGQTKGRRGGGSEETGGKEQKAGTMARGEMKPMGRRR